MASVTMRVQTDSQLMARFQAALFEEGISLDSAINHYMREKIREHGIPPLFTTPEKLGADLRTVREAHGNGAEYIPFEVTASRIDRVIAGAGEQDACFSTSETVQADIQAAEEAWKNGYQGHTLEEVLAGMERIIEEAGVEGT